MSNPKKLNTPEKPSLIGRNVLYVVQENPLSVLPAIIVKSSEDRTTVSLQVYRADGDGTILKSNIPYSLSKKADTWHFPR